MAHPLVAVASAPAGHQLPGGELLKEQPAPAASPRWKRTLLTVWDFLGDNWFIVGLAFAIGFGAAVPNLGRNGGWIAAQWTIKYGAVIVIFILSGCSLKTKVLVQAAARAHVHLYSQLLSLGLTPLIGYTVYRLLRTASWIDPNLTSGLVVATSMPTTISTNVVFTQQAGGNGAMALINAVIGNIIGIFVSPALLTLYINMSGQAPYASVLQNMTVTIIAPLVVGQLFQFFVPKAVAWLQARVNFSKVSNVMILLLVWNTFCGTFYSNVKAQNAGSVVLVVAMCVLLYGVFTVVCLGAATFVATTPALQRWFKITRPDTVALMYIGATKTLALGMPLISVLYAGSDEIALLALPLICFHASQTFQGNFLIKPLRRWVESEPKLLSTLAGAAQSHTSLGISAVDKEDDKDVSPPASPTAKAKVGAGAGEQAPPMSASPPEVGLTQQQQQAGGAAMAVGVGRQEPKPTVAGTAQQA